MSQAAPIKAYAARRFTPAVENAMAERYDVVRNEGDQVMDAETLTRKAKGCAYLFVTVTERVSASVIQALLPELKVICTLSVGTDHVDLKAAREAGVAVLFTPDVLSEACAEVAMLLILNTARRGREAEAMVRDGAWPGWAPTQMLGLGLVGRRLGILGLGRIGREVANRAASFGMLVHYHNRNRLGPEDERGAIYHATSDALLAHSDIFCITAPATPALAGFLDARRLALLPKDAIVVNVARGDMINDDDLIAALSEGKLFAAGLDVFRGEPNIDPRYRTLSNVYLTPHIGSATIQTRDAMGFLLLDGLQALERGEQPANRL